MSDSLPTHKNPTVNPICQDTASQTAFCVSPSSFEINERVFAGKTYPRYPDICAKHVAINVLRNFKER